MRRFDASRPERNDVRALVAPDHGLRGAELARVRDAEDFQISLLEHGAVVRRAPGLNRAAGHAGALVVAAAGEIKAETLKRLQTRIEIRYGNTHVIEVESDGIHGVHCRENSAAASACNCAVSSVGQGVATSRRRIGSSVHPSMTAWAPRIARSLTRRAAWSAAAGRKRPRAISSKMMCSRVSLSGPGGTRTSSP